MEPRYAEVEAELKRIEEAYGSYRAVPGTSHHSFPILDVVLRLSVVHISRGWCIRPVADGWQVLGGPAPFDVLEPTVYRTRYGARQEALRRSRTNNR